MFADLRRVAKLIGHQPTLIEYRAHGAHSDRTIFRRFGTWRAFIEAAGLVYRPEAHGRYTDEEIERDLRRVRALLGHPPTSREYRLHGRMNDETLYRRSGGQRWADVLTRFLGIDADEARRYTVRNSYRTERERFDELRALAAKLGHTPTATEAREHGIAITSLRHQFGGWRQAVVAAGLPEQKHRGNAKTLYTPTAEIIADVVRVARQLGRAPSSTEQSRYGRFNRTTVCARLGIPQWAGVREIVEKRLGIRARELPPAPMGDVSDPVRDHIKGSSVEAIAEYFKKKKP